MFHKLILWLKNLFGFSQREANGFIILILLSICLIALPYFLKNFTSEYSLEADQKKLDSLITLIDYSNSSETADNYNTTEKKGGKKYISTAIDKVKSKHSKLFKFDPNNLSIEDWLKLGIEEYLAKRIHNYLKNGGSFNFKSDLEKIYGLDRSLYVRLHPFITLPEKPVKNILPKENDKRTEVTPTLGHRKENHYYNFELNTSEAQDFIQFKGIGAKLSQRIIKFRNNLGGFNNSNQLYEIYGIDSSIVSVIIENTSIDKVKVKPIKINSVILDSLRKHPYISYKLAKVIVNYREMHGPYGSKSDLKKIHILKDDVYIKLEPYIELD